MSATTNGASNGTAVSHHEGHGSVRRVTILREITSSASIKGDRELASTSSYDVRTVGALLDYIARERLRRMPHPGSKWDKILQWAAYFVSQAQLFAEETESFLSHSQEAASIICSNCHHLLELGPDHAQILEQIFSTFYSAGATLAFFSQQKEYFVTVTEIHKALAYIFSDLLQLVVDVTSQYGSSSKSSMVVTSSSFFQKFGQRITAIHARKDEVMNHLWIHIMKRHARSSGYAVDISTVRGFLSSSDRLVRALTTNSLGPKASPAEFTCEWFRKYLVEFTRSDEKVFVVSGKEGFGKTVLFDWIVENLQRAGSSNSKNVLSFAIDADIKTQTSITAVLKGLLLQLLDINLGDLAFYDVLCEALTASSKTSTPADSESALWHALETGLHHAHETIIVIDGLDQLEGRDTSSVKLLEHLHQLSDKHTHVKSLALTQPLGKAVSKKTKSFTIESSHTQRDIRKCIQETITTTPQFRQIGHEDADKVITKISTSAEGSFVWALISLELLKREKTVSGMLQVVDTLPRSVTDSLKRLVSFVDIKGSDTRSLLAWLLAAERPLTLEEIKAFYEIELNTCSVRPRFSDVEQDVVRALGPLITISNGTVRFRHQIVRTYFTNLASSVKDYSNTGSFPFMLKEAHYDLATRCLAYTKLFVTTRVEPSFDALSETVLTNLFTQYICFEYAATYWISHFIQSPMYDPAGKHRLVPEFQNCFAPSVLLALVESSIWQTTYTTTDYTLALQIRETVIGKSTLCTLQSMITVAKLYERLTILDKASTYYYQIYQLTQTLLDDEHDTVITSIFKYLTTTSTITITDKTTEIYTHRETLLKKIIAINKRTKGVSHDTTVTYLQMLATLYTQAKQMDFALTTYQELYSVYLEKYGKQHTETQKIYQTLIEVAEKSSKKDEILRSHTTTTTKKDTTQVTTVKKTTEETAKSKLDMYEYYESKGETSKAESALVELWRSVSETASKTRDTKSETKKMDISLKYIDFLKRHKRTTEAQTVTESLWADYRRQDVHSEAVASSIMMIAKEMKQYNTKVARSMYQSVYGFFKKQQNLTSTEASTAVAEIEEINEEIVTRSQTTDTTKASTAVQESSLLEILESSSSTLTSATSTKALSSIVKTCLQLSSLYTVEGRWSETYSLCSQTLSSLWPYSVTQKGVVALPTEFKLEAITLATRMGEALYHLYQLDRAETVFLAVFQGTKATLKPTDELVLKTLKVVLDFYEQTFQYKKWIKLYTDVLEEYKTTLGSNNVMIYRMITQVADFCQRFHLPEAERYWNELYTLSVKDGIVQEPGMPATVHLLTIYEQDQRWDAADKLTTTLWETFSKRSTDTTFTTAFVEKIYSVRSHVLEVKKASFEERHKFISMYRDTCVKVFGARNEITLQATMELAQILETREDRREEAISLYEAAYNQSKTTSTASATVSQSIVESRRRLTRLYSKQTTSTAKATTTSTESFEATRAQYGWSDERTLESVQELVSVSAKSQSQESITKAVQILQSTVVETVMTEHDSEQVTKSASMIAQSYLEISKREVAIELVREIRHQVITGQYTASNKFGISMKGTDRRASVFIIAFEQALGLTSKSASFSELLADLQTEALLYQAYHESVTKKAKFDIILEHAVALLDFYHSKSRTEERKRVFTDLLERFATTLSVSKTTILQHFLELYIKEVNQTSYQTTVLLTVTGWILAKTKEHKHQDAYELALYTDKFVHIHGGWTSQQHVICGLEIALYLMGRRGAEKCGNGQIYQTMLELSRVILKEVMVAAKDLDIRFIQMKVDLVNDVISVLSEQQNYIDLESILASLWNSRQQQTSWSSDTIVLIGRRLVEVRFALNRRDAAIHLCEDIIYNVRRVWGPYDQTTLDLIYLLAELYNAAGDHAKALQVYTEMLETTSMAIEEGTVSNDRAVSIVQTGVDLMKRAYVRNGGFGKDKSTALYRELFEQLTASLGEDKVGKTLSGVDKWSTKEKIDDKGIWVRPTSFEFIKTASTEAQHKNNIRVTNGALEPLLPASPRSKGRFRAPSVRSVKTTVSANGSQ